MNTLLFVNAAIGFSENLFLVMLTGCHTTVCLSVYQSVCLLFYTYIFIVAFLQNAIIEYSLESVCVSMCVCVCFSTITQKVIDLGT